MLDSDWCIIGSMTTAHFVYCPLNSYLYINWILDFKIYIYIYYYYYNGVSRVYTLRNSTRLPPHKVILNVTKNKILLIDLIVSDLIAHKTDLQTHTPVVGGSDPISVDILKCSVRKHHDPTTTHEEADTIIIQQVARVEGGTILVIAVTHIYSSYCGTSATLETSLVMY